jgi:hypothetical protein
MSKYYKVHLSRGSKLKNKRFEDTIYIQASDTDGINKVLDVVRKISFGRLISALSINRKQYEEGVRLAVH